MQTKTEHQTAGQVRKKFPYIKQTNLKTNDYKKKKNEINT